MAESRTFTRQIVILLLIAASSLTISGPTGGVVVAVTAPGFDPSVSLPVARVNAGPAGVALLDVAAGTYNVTVTAPGYATIFRESVRFPVKASWTMARGGVAVTGVVSPPTWVAATRGRGVAYVQPNEEGVFSVSVPEGLVSVSAFDPGLGSAALRQAVDPATCGKIALRLGPIPNKAVPTQAQVGLLKDAAKPWAVEAVGAMLGDTRIVAMGEPAFGTNEFAQLKQSLLEYLVREHGFSVLVVSGAVSDRLMRWAEQKNVTIFRTELPRSNAKVMVWGHNTQMAALRERLGGSVLIIGGVFDEGVYQSRVNGTLTDLVATPEPSSVAHAFTMAGFTQAVLDLRPLREPLFTEPRVALQVGADFNDAQQAFRMGKLFDALVFVRRTTRR